MINFEVLLLVLKYILFINLTLCLVVRKESEGMEVNRREKKEK